MFIWARAEAGTEYTSKESGPLIEVNIFIGNILLIYQRVNGNR